MNYTQKQKQLKKVEWVNGNHMKIETGHKTFDRQCDSISTGNVMGDAQFSWFIRSWWDEGEGLMDYPENKREPGRLFQFDIKAFEQLPLPVYRKMEAVAKEKGSKSHILYEFRHFNAHEKHVHGYVITDEDYNHVYHFVVGGLNKGYSVIYECMKYVCTKKSLEES